VETALETAAFAVVESTVVVLVLPTKLLVKSLLELEAVVPVIVLLATEDSNELVATIPAASLAASLFGIAYIAALDAALDEVVLAVEVPAFTDLDELSATVLVDVVLFDELSALEV
jgi:hypothetical protein